MNTIDLGYAYFIDQDSLNITNKKWKPFVGVGYSINTYEEDISEFSTQSKFTLKTQALMLGVGIDYEIDKNQFITMGYDFSLSTSGTESMRLTDGGNTYNVNVEVDKVSRWLLSYHYKF